MNYDVDLNAAIQLRDRTKTSFLNLAPSVREAFPNWEAVFRGIIKGDLVAKDGTITLTPPKTEKPVTPSAPTA